MASHSVSPLQNHLAAGAMAGVTVDTVLFPLDTLKTRLQSKAGLRATGGAGRLYAGLSSTLLGSAPSAGLFFVSYESLKGLFGSQRDNPAVHSLTAAIAEVAACAVRVPVEVIKQRMQVGIYRHSVPGIVVDILRADGFFGLYRGFHATIQREIPFAMIQFPLYETFKTRLVAHQDEQLRMALCGSAAGGLTALLTTPLDVIKTRTMLARDTQDIPSASVLRALRDIWHEGGMRRLFAGAVPRVLWISAGGFVFFGVYERARRHLDGNSGNKIDGNE